MFFPTLYAGSQPCYPYLVANGHHIQFILGWLDAAEFPTVLHQTFAFSHETPLGNETKLQDCCGCGKTTYFYCCDCLIYSLLSLSFLLPS